MTEAVTKPEALVKTIEGSCQEISEKNGWTTFHINVGTKYPIRLATKLATLIDQGRAVGTNVATWTYKEVVSETINENTGKPYVNNYFEKVEVSGNEPTHIPPQGWEQAERDAAPHNTGSTAAPQRPAAGEHAPLAIGDKERSITRMACLKAAADLFSGQGNTEVVGEGVRDNVSELLSAADRMERWVMRDLQDIPFLWDDNYSAEATQSEWSDPWRQG